MCSFVASFYVENVDSRFFNNLSPSYFTKIDKYLEKCKFAAGDEISWVDYKLLYWFGVFEKYSSKIASLRNLHKHRNFVINASCNDFKEYYEYNYDKFLVCTLMSCY